MVLPDEISDDDSKESDEEARQPEPDIVNAINLSSF